MTAATFYRRFRLDIECNGTRFQCEREAVDERAAFRCVAHSLAVSFPRIEAHQVQVRLVACVEVAA